MTAEAFCRWLEMMREAGRIVTDADAGTLLGISANSVVHLKRRGADMRTALACSALLLGLKPFGSAGGYFPAIKFED